MNENTLEELDLEAWVNRAEPNQRNFREAVHIILTAISTSAALASRMVMKGGMLMAIRYNSERFTKDADFSTRDKYLKGDEQQLLQELRSQLDSANELLAYDTMCRCQKHELRPASGNASFPTLTLSIGYAPRSHQRQRERLMAGQAPTIVEIDYSYNEAVLDIEVLSLGDGDKLKAYSYLNLLAEKIRSLLQQPARDRYRRQDIYDINMLIGNHPLDAAEQNSLLDLIIQSSLERNIEAKIDSMSNPQVREMAERGYLELAAEITGELPPFSEAYGNVEKFYESLPWKTN